MSCSAGSRPVASVFAKTAGKVKTVLQCLSIAAILTGLWLQVPAGSPWLRGRNTLSDATSTISSYFYLT